MMHLHLQKRGNRWYFRRPVPKDLQAHYPHKTLLVALGTSDYDVAKERASALTVQTNNEFAGLRGVTPDTWEAPGRLAYEYLAREELENAEEWERERRANREYHEAVDEGARQQAASVERTLKAAGLPTMTELVDAVDFGLTVDRPQPPGKTQDITKPNQARLGASQGKAETLRHIVPVWISRNAPKKESQTQAQRALDLFEEAVGVVPVRDLTKAHGAAFVRFLLSEKRGFGRKTASNHAALITALANVAVKDDRIERNPMDLSFDKSIGAGQRKPWSDAELEAIFSCPLFSERMDTMPQWMNVAHEDARAALLMVLHTGVRIGEIGQLRRQDFLVRGGIKAIHITAEAGSVKTDDSERVVPLASHLLADPWFAGWLVKVMDGTNSAAPALPSVNGRRNDRPSDILTKWFKAFREHLKLPAGRLNGTHKFRHWIRSALADKGVGDATADSITGHAAQGSSGRIVYTAAASLPVMLEALDRITYPKVNQSLGHSSVASQ
ncbi:DUF6538 domain-containing protein [Paraburkholderia sp. EG285A]|uniref:DUF6538 domain-containing protein n=1 Tax=Paraburkholderia sp. EG285A TaxID=3237009 RepID=UPI0034D1F1DE